MRIALCIGCNSYEHLGSLRGAEEDARRIYATLTSPRYGNYDPSRSRLLLSPTMAEVRSALGELLYTGERVDDFSFFFAGHGGVEYGTLYLALKDTNSKSLAFSGFSFSDVARLVVAAQPTQANFVFDACGSGGLGFDLPSILKQSLTGTPESTGVAAIAAAAANESALEVPDGGAFTTELLKVLKGEVVAQRHRPFLGIPDIGSVLRLDGDESEKQTVSTWVLNLQGPNRFSQNPHFTHDDNKPDVAVLALGRRLNLSENDIIAIRRITLGIRDEIDELDLAGLLERLASDLSPDDAVTLLSGLAETMAEEAKESPDPFAQSRILGVFLGQLLSYASSSGIVGPYLIDLAQRTYAVDLEALRTVARELQSYKYRLVAPDDALSDLFFLPLRVTDILGRIGHVLLYPDVPHEDIGILKNLTATLLGIYGNSVLSISEEQAAPIAVFLAACGKHQWTDIAEEVICRLYSDLVDNHGRVASHFLNGDESLNVLEQRYVEVVKPKRGLYQSPSELATVILFLGALNNLDEAIDPSLILIDHTSLNVFIPKDLHQLGSKGPIGGQNLGYTIGHGIWRCIDARREWDAHISPFFKGQLTSLSEVELLAGIAACLSLRDRVPWAVVTKVAPYMPAKETCKIYFEEGGLLIGASKT